MPLSKPFLHAIKLFYPYQSQLNKLIMKNPDPEQIWRSLLYKEEVCGDPHKEWEKLINSGLNAVSIDEESYPKLLKEITDPPALLYYRGALPNCSGLLPDSSLNLAFVGSRKMSSYGKQSLELILSTLANQKINIISGLAYGIDSASHEIALKIGLKTFAVLGSGIDDESIYPYPNKRLAHQIILAGGGILSEFPPGTKGLAMHFPMRNRIISGLSEGVVIIEANFKSGALITGRLALDQNRDVFAIPGNIFEESSAGTNNLIKLGAKPITNGQDLLMEYQLKSGVQLTLSSFLLSEVEKKIMNFVKAKPVSIFEIIAQTKLLPGEINSALTTLEIKDLIKSFPDKKYGANLTASYKSG
jgi:DNA processing protein